MRIKYVKMKILIQKVLLSQFMLGSVGMKNRWNSINYEINNINFINISLIMETLLTNKTIFKPDPIAWSRLIGLRK